MPLQDLLAPSTATTKKKQFIELYTDPDGRASMQQIAIEVGVSRRTLHRWLREPEIQKEIIKAERLRAMSLLPKAINALGDLVENGGDSARVKAAGLIYQSAGLLVKDNIEVTLKKQESVIDLDAVMKKYGIDNGKPAGEIEANQLEPPQTFEEKRGLKKGE